LVQDLSQHESHHIVAGSEIFHTYKHDIPFLLQLALGMVFSVVFLALSQFLHIHLICKGNYHDFACFREHSIQNSPTSKT